MIYYLTLGTNNLARSGAFYDAVLATLGHSRILTTDTDLGYGKPGDASPTLYLVTPFDGAAATRGNGTMLALTATTRAAVHDFYTTALAQGGTDEGAPGLRYSANFYSCYVRDPDGNKLSVVCNLPHTD